MERRGAASSRTVPAPTAPTFGFRAGLVQNLADAAKLIFEDAPLATSSINYQLAPLIATAVVSCRGSSPTPGAGRQSYVMVGIP